MHAGHVFDFDETELADNRAGRLSRAQRSALMKLLGRRLFRQRPVPLAGLVGLVVAVGLLATAAHRFLSRAALGPALPLIGLALAAAAGAGLLIARRAAPPPGDEADPFDTQIRDDRVESFSGRVRATPTELFVGPVLVGYLTRPRRDPASVLDAGQVYTVYTIEIDGARLLLSLEVQPAD